MSPTHRGSYPDPMHTRTLQFLGALLAALCACGAAHAQENAATIYRQLFTQAGWMRTIGERGPATQQLLTPEENDFVSRIQSPIARADRAKLDEILARTAGFRGQLAEATKIRRSDWELDRSRGFDMLLPHLTPMRSASRLLRAQLAAQLDDGDGDAAVQTLASIGGLAGHSGQDGILVSSLVGSAIGSIFTETGTLTADWGLIDQKRATSLLDALGPLQGSDPFHYGDALKGEWDAVRASINGMQSDEALRSLLSMTGPPGDREASTLTLAQAKGELRRMKPMYDAAVAAFANPDPNAARAAIKQLEADVESGKYGQLAKALAPSLSSVYESRLRSQQDLALFLERLRAIAAGKETATDTMNAALLLARASVAARSIPDDAQEAIELLRVAPGALDPAAVKRADEMLARSDRSVTALLAQAANLKRCDFSILRRPLPSLEVPLLGGLRGAVRATLAAGLRDARARASADPGALAAILGFRAAALLATDPSLSRAAVGRTIWVESTAALEESLKAGPLTAKVRDEVERALGTMPPADPFGFRKGIERDAVRAVDEMVRYASGATAEAREARAQILRQRGPTSMFARVALATAARGDDDSFPDAKDGILVRLADVYPPDAVVAVSKVLAEAKARYQEPRKDTAALKDLAILPPIPFDLPLDEQKTRFKREDVVRGVTFMDPAIVAGLGTAEYLRGFDVLKAAKIGN